MRQTVNGEHVDGNHGKSYNSNKLTLVIATVKGKTAAG